MGSIPWLDLAAAEEQMLQEDTNQPNSSRDAIEMLPIQDTAPPILTSTPSPPQPPQAVAEVTQTTSSHFQPSDEQSVPCDNPLAAASSEELSDPVQASECKDTDLLLPGNGDRVPKRKLYPAVLHKIKRSNETKDDPDTQDVENHRLQCAKELLRKD